MAYGGLFHLSKPLTDATIQLRRGSVSCQGKRMPRIAAVATALPPYKITQAEARAFAASYFRSQRRDVDRLLPVFDHSGIESRYLCVPPDWFTSPKTFAEKNGLYIDWCTRLGAQVMHDCLDQAGLSAGRIDHLIFVSTTGLATPSIDSRLINVLGLRSHVRRTPIWGLGCAGGAAGLSHTYREAISDPNAVVMLVTVELCGLTFHFGDFSKSNFIASALFADGAAGALVVGDDVTECAAGGPAILAAQSTIWPDSLDVMGWNFDNVGMQVVFSHAIPGIVKEKTRQNMDEFLGEHDLTFEQVRHLVVHPGGAKVIDAYQNALSLDSGRMAQARTVLRDFGNMSAPTVLFVLKQTLANGSVSPGDYGVLTALGPGFSAENVLLRF